MSSLVSRILSSIDEANVYTDYSRWLKSIPTTGKVDVSASNERKYNRLAILSESIDRVSVDLKLYLTENSNFFSKVASDISKVLDSFQKAVDEDNEALMASSVNVLKDIIKSLEEQRSIITARNKKIQQRYKLTVNV